VSGMFVQKNRENPSILLKVTIDNVGVPFLRHGVEQLFHVPWCNACYLCDLLACLYCTMCLKKRPEHYRL